MCKRIAHCDIKPDNILINDELKLVFADFGNAVIGNLDELRTYKGTKTYMAPEIKEGKTYDGRQADVFAVGVILFVMGVGTFPFEEATSESANYNLIIEGKNEEFWNKFDQKKELTTEFKDLMLSMVSYDASKRPNIQKIMNHPWMKL